MSSVDSFHTARSNSSNSDGHQAEGNEFPKSGMQKNARFRIVETDRAHETFSAVIPNGVVFPDGTTFPMDLTVEGNLEKKGGRMTVRDERLRVLVDVISGNAGFHITDWRTGTRFILSRNGSTYFLYGVAPCGKKTPVAVIRPGTFGGKASVHHVNNSPSSPNRLQSRNNNNGVSSTDTSANPGRQFPKYAGTAQSSCEEKIGTLFRHRFSFHKLLGLPRVFAVKTKAGFDGVMLVVLRMCYEAICSTTVNQGFGTEFFDTFR